ncbi:MAG: bacteriocin-protection protein YdeI/OmpD-associated family [Chitinophagaceae bacterium]|nr:bacteriocin-protection protein YdeI/OmpD-associated family [Chitinophagaceae bacterium]
MKSSETAEYKVLSFKTPVAFEKWLAKKHNKVKGIWMRYFKKDSGEKTITHKEALDLALCYGWIDGQADKYDDISWLVKFTPRGAKSIWSKKNTGNIERLTSLGKMKPSGLAEVEKAKADGRWDRAYDAQSTMQIPDELVKQLSKNKKAKAFFDTLNRTNKFAIVWRLQTAKKPDTREKRLKLILEMLSNQQKFH